MSKQNLENPRELILKAIQDGNYEELNLLLTPGVKLHPSWFLLASEKHGWRMVQILLQNDPNGVFVKNENGETLLMIHINDIEAVRYLFDHGANSLKYKCQNGQTDLLHALQQAQPNLQVLRLLIEGGTHDLSDLTLDEDSNSSAHVALNAFRHAVEIPQCYKIEIFQLFIEIINTDPDIDDEALNKVIYRAVDQFAWMLYRKLTRAQNGELNEDDDTIKIDPFGEEMNKFRQEKNEALEYLLRLPQFRLNQHDPPQSIYLNQWNLVPMYDMPKILASPQFQQTRINPRKFHFLISSSARIQERLRCIPEEIFISPLTLSISSVITYDADAQKYMLKFLKSLVENGLRVNERDSFSPLTIVIYKFMYGILKVNGHEKTVFKYITSGEKAGEEVKSELVELAKFLIEKGAHVGQSIVPFVNQFNFEDYRFYMRLPDAVYAAFESGCFFLLPLVLPYFAQTPLFLLMFADVHLVNLVNAIFPILCKGGPIPPGSKFLFDLIVRLDVINRDLEIDHVYTKFLEMHSSPPSLKHLCRCVIRRSYANRASQPGESLPELMRSFEIPEELKDYLEMPAPERLDVFYCDDPIMAQLANKGVQELERERDALLQNDE